MKVKLKEKKYYSIGEVSKAFDVNTSLIRFWEKEFPDLNPKKNSSGKRKFTAVDIKLIKKIYFLLKVKGYTINGANSYMKNSKKKSMDNFEIIDKLNDIKSRLLKIKGEL